LITGALTGIGRATAIAFANEGAKVVGSGRRAEEGQKLAAELRTLGANAEFLQADVRRESDVQNIVDQTVTRFGHLGVAVNNAGTEAILDHSLTKPPKLTPRHLTRMFSEHC
jgi:NAD(P)-dependent dehydrogenase (short-subunit alcohol dehydrogenase family)